MKTIKLDIIDENIYYDKLDNGLEIYLIKKEKFNSSFVSFLTNFGGLDLEFIPINEDKMVKMPSGIAHFLEHKLFEQENGESVHDFYNKSGAYVNAMTGYKKTRYIFKGSNNFKENLNYLLDYVQSPYFTDKNVEKEKGIILEEARMDLDNPDVKFRETIFKNLYTSELYNKTIIGTMDDIKSITKEDLYRCYNSFYHPSNMVLFIVTNEDEKEVFNLIKQNQNKKKFKKDFVIKKKEYIEEEKVNIEKEIIEENVQESRVCYSLKFKLSSFKATKVEVVDYLFIMLGILVGNLSKFNIDLITKKIIKDNISYSINWQKVKNEEYITVSIYTLTDKYNKFITLLEKQLLSKNYTKEDFDLFKKTFKSDLNYYFDSVNGIMNFMISEYDFNGSISNETLEIENNLNYDKFKEIIGKFNIKNKSIVIMKKQ